MRNTYTYTRAFFVQKCFFAEIFSPNPKRNQRKAAEFTFVQKSAHKTLMKLMDGRGNKIKNFHQNIDNQTCCSLLLDYKVEEARMQ